MAMLGHEYRFDDDGDGPREDAAGGGSSGGQQQQWQQRWQPQLVQYQPQQQQQQRHQQQQQQQQQHGHQQQQHYGHRQFQHPQSQSPSQSSSPSPSQSQSQHSSPSNVRQQRGGPGAAFAPPPRTHSRQQQHQHQHQPWSKHDDAGTADPADMPAMFEHPHNHQTPHGHPGHQGHQGPHGYPGHQTHHRQQYSPNPNHNHHQHHNSHNNHNHAHAHTPTPTHHHNPPPLSRPFRLQNHPPPSFSLRPSSSPRPVLNLRSDVNVNVPPALTSARSDSFYYGSRPPRASPSPTPTISHFQPPPHRTRAESTPPTTSRLAPRSAFPGLSSNPYIPESPESVTTSASSPPQPETHKFPLLSHQHDQLARLSPVSNLESPVSSRQSTPTEPNMPTMGVENFSRPRKPSVPSQQSDSALSWRMAAHRPHAAAAAAAADPPLQLDQPPTSNPQHQAAPPNFNPAPNPWPRNRRLSQSSSQSSSTYSSIPPRSSNDHLNAAPPRIDFPRHQNPTAGGPPVSFPRQPHSHYNTPYNAPQTHLREGPSWLATGDESRSGGSSFRSQFTTSTAHGTVFTASGTERNSILTKTSSITEQSIINGYARGSWRPSSVDDGVSLEDVMGMYERGFRDSDIDMDSIRRSMKFPDDDDLPDTEALEKESSRPDTSHSDASELRAKMLEAMNDPLPSPTAMQIPGSGVSTARQSRTRHSLLPSSLPTDVGLGLATEHMSRRNKNGRSDSMEKHDSAKMLDGDDNSDTFERDQVETPSPTSPTSPVRSPAPAAMPPSPRAVDPTPAPAPAPAPVPAPPTVSMFRLPQEPTEEPGSRDRYGFRKASANVTRQQYDAWDSTYSEYLVRRRRKWIAFLKDNSLMTDRPNRFPPRSAKTKRFIRKGIPPDWRGAAWFYYAGGPAILSKHHGLYEQLVQQAGLERNGPGRIPNQASEVKPLVIEDIEKDLYRTFPDNIRFKPPPPPGASPQLAAARPATEPEIISSLRRVLHAFALYNPRIGYCQSLNFLAGLLLLFVDTEEQAFWLLNIITRVYLPGTHEMSLEGSKVDLGVLMVALKDSLPTVWKQIGGDELEAGKRGGGWGKRGAKGHGGNPGSISDPNRLPAITLCMTAWFMSCFVGTLPIETVLRVWDVFFYEGSRTLFRISLALFKLGEREIKAVQDPMEMFGVVQSFPRRMVDCNTLMETCYRRRNGIGHLSQESVEEKRQERRDGIRKWKAEQEAAAAAADAAGAGGGDGPRPTTRHRFGAAALGLDLAADIDEVRRKANLFGRKKDREQVRAAEVA
ncbi:hypothetical protein C8A05DRAFT_38018 [Staphylotrichum tortipilum]|uniref:Rab-GAP TBC domain-containing protein n=1 Tax=Staphylotrichum tortipilum TaxID=2831512 RepID=A0AAN6MCR1_9PEZI|nr:hypothetical protein C8A05DRAFT_38018 [Staphylotrichum longicolle]